MKKKILLTGATGYLGSHLAKAFLSAGHEVIALKRKSSSLRRVKSISSEIKFVDIEALDYDNFFHENKSIDVIIHTATCYGRNCESASQIFSVNTEFPLHILDAGSRAGVKLFLNTDTTLDKNLNLYAFSKNQFQQWGKYFSQHSKIRFGNIRLEHFYGPYDEPTKFTSHIISSCLNNVLELKLTAGEQKRDFIYIDDVVSAYMVLLGKLSDIEESFVEFEVGSGHSVPIREFVEIVHSLTNSKTHLNFGAVSYRKGELMHSEANVSGLVALGWQCLNNVDSGLKKIIEIERMKI